MAGRTDGLIKNFRASGAIPARRFVKFGTADVEVALSTAAADATIGVTVELPADAGERVDVALSDIADVTFGGPVTRGDPVTSDAQGRAVLAAPGAGVTMRINGFAFASGVLGDVSPVRLAPSFIRG